MIINENNKNNVLKGTVKRGFNQTPAELQEKIFNEINGVQKPKEKQNMETVKQNNSLDMPQAQKLNSAYNNLKRMK